VALAVHSDITSSAFTALLLTLEAYSIEILLKRERPFLLIQIQLLGIEKHFSTFL
jgi:hypothetical protein